MAVPDVQIRGGGGLKTFFSALRASVWFKNKGRRAPRHLPWIHHCLFTRATHGDSTFHTIISIQNVANCLHEKQKVGSSRRLTCLVVALFCDSRVTLLAGPAFLHTNTLAWSPNRQLGQDGTIRACMGTYSWIRLFLVRRREAHINGVCVLYRAPHGLGDGDVWHFRLECNVLA